MISSEIQSNMFGKTGMEITRVGLGGEGILRTTGKTESAHAVIREALSRQITYFDCARVYSDSELYYGGVWDRAPQMRSAVFQASKSASRDRNGARMDLEQTLFRMKIDYLDLWQIHDVRTRDDMDKIAGPGGALEAFTDARSEGLVRFIGVTGHHDPEILTRAVQQWPVDAVMLPVNPAEAVLGGFLDGTLVAAREKGIGIIGMKILGAGNYISPRAGVSADLLIRFALDQKIDVAIVGCSNPSEVQTLADAGKNGKPLSETEVSDLIEKFRPHARRLAYYRSG